MVDPMRRRLLKAGAAAAAMAATPSALAQQSGSGESGRFYQRGNVRIRYEEVGTGFPLLLISGGGLSGRRSRASAAAIRSIRLRHSRESSAAFTLTFATQPASPPVRSRLTGRGIPTPTTISV